MCQDEIKTLSKNYETQLSVMSDHMCSLNDQLMRKSEEVQNSRQVKVSKFCSVMYCVVDYSYKWSY